MISMTIGEKIKEERNKKGLTQENLANLLEVTRQSVQKWETGQNQPDTDKIVRLSYIFNVTTDYLLKDENNVPNDLTEKQEVVTNSIITLGYREKYVEIWKIILLWSIYTIITLAAGISLFFLFYNSELIIAIMFLLLFISTSPLGIIATIQYLTAFVNNKKIDKPVLVYKQAEDVFVCYNSHRYNNEITIKNGNIRRVIGSSFNTGNCCDIVYIDEKGKRRRKTIGYCSNINNYGLKNNINKYHNPKI